MADEVAAAVPQGGEDKEHLGTSGNAPSNPDTQAALEALLKEVTETPESKAAAEEAAAEEQRKADEAAKAEEQRKADEAAKAAGKTEEELAAAKAEEQRKADEAAKATPEDKFDKVKLPPYAKPATTEAFSTVKTLAREEIRLAQEATKAAEEKARLAEEKLAKGPGEEVTKELTELREFRQKMDVEADPSFKEFDAKIKSNDDLVYAKLKAAGTTEETLKKIQELGGPGAIDWDTTGEKLNPSVKRYIEGKIFENEDLLVRWKEAVDSAKKNASEFLKTRQQETSVQAETRRKSLETEVNTLLPQLGWVAPKTADEKATPAEKAAVEAHNKLVQLSKEYVAEALGDDSPKMKAILVAGFVELQKVRADIASNTAAHEAKVKELEAKLKESTDLVEKIKKSSSGRLRESSAPAPGTPSTSKLNLHESTEDALARLRHEHESAQS